MAFIYKLSFPNDERVYIGQTSQTVEARLKEHIWMLTNNRHHSKTLQKAYNSYKILPTISIILECNYEDLNQNEIVVVKQYNSFRNGFNQTLGGTQPNAGEGHPSANYLLEDYSCVLTFLAYTTLTHREIAEETGVSYSVVETISDKSTHVYLKELMPEEYALMEKRNKKAKITYKNIVSPEGIVYKVDSATQFAKEHYLHQPALQKVLKGTQAYTEGWYLEGNKPYIPPKEYSIVSPEGILYTFKIIIHFANEHNLNNGELGKVLKGVQSMHKGWRLPTKEELNVNN